MKEPRVSIILVNYNGWKDTMECLNSLERVDYKNFDIFIVDNCSTDDSVARIRKYTEKRKRVTLLISAENKGFSSGNNIGIKEALKTGAEYVVLLNNDTVVRQDFLTCAIQTAKENGSAGIVTGKILYYSDPDTIWYGGGRLLKRSGVAVHRGYMEADCGQRDVVEETGFISGCFMVLTKTCIEKAGILPEEYFLYCEDTAYCHQVRNAGFKLIYDYRSVICHKVSASAGKDSRDCTYYSVRNTLLVHRKYDSKNWLFFLFYGYFLVKQVVLGRWDCDIVTKALLDYRDGKTGRVRYEKGEKE